MADSLLLMAERQVSQWLYRGRGVRPWVDADSPDLCAAATESSRRVIGLFTASGFSIHEHSSGRGAWRHAVNGYATVGIIQPDGEIRCIDPDTTKGMGRNDS